jgi:hypothetical protein
MFANDHKNIYFYKTNLEYKYDFSTDIEIKKNNNENESIFDSNENIKFIKSYGTFDFNILKEMIKSNDYKYNIKIFRLNLESKEFFLEFDYKDKLNDGIPPHQYPNCEIFGNEMFIFYGELTEILFCYDFEKKTIKKYKSPLFNKTDYFHFKTTDKLVFYGGHIGLRLDHEHQNKWWYCLNELNIFNIKNKTWSVFNIGVHRSLFYNELSIFNPKENKLFISKIKY